MNEVDPATGKRAHKVTDADALTAEAARWIRRAARAWADDDAALVTVSAPMAVEQLGKAFLWRTNPLLALPIDRNREDLFIRVALNPSLADPSLRTIGLGEVLKRLKRIISPWPLTDDGAKQLKEARDGAVHVGTRAATPPAQLLRLAITACDRLLGEIGSSAESFYGERDMELVDTLRKNYRSKVEELVGARRARAAHHLQELSRTTGDQFNEVVALKEATAADHLDGRLSDDGALIGLEETCPVCSSAGRLYGRPDVDYEFDHDVEPLGGGKYDAILISVPVVTLSPLAFGCNVCRLLLDGPDELETGTINPQPRRVDPSALPDDIDFSDLYGEQVIEDGWPEL